MRIAYKIVFGKLERQKLLEYLVEGTVLKIDLGEVWCEGPGWI
jgi:hypothetical protein